MLGRLQMIVDGKGQPCGYIWLATKRWGSDLAIFALELAPQINGQVALSALLPHLRTYGEQLPPVPGNAKPFSELCLHLAAPIPFMICWARSWHPVTKPPTPGICACPICRPSFVRSRRILFKRGWRIPA